MDKRCKEFIQEKILELIQAGFSISLKKSKHVEGCNGFFCDDPKEFAVAIGKPQKEWLPIFVHEYSHFLQWKEKCPIWDESCEDWNHTNLWDWYDGIEEYTKDKLFRSTRLIQKLEQDCDKRALALIVQNDLPFDPQVYIQKSNSYIWLYEISLRYRSWYKTAPYRDADIISLMPTEFISPKQFAHPPKEFTDIVVDRCLKRPLIS